MPKMKNVKHLKTRIPRDITLYDYQRDTTPYAVPVIVAFKTLSRFSRLLLLHPTIYAYRMYNYTIW